MLNPTMHTNWKTEVAGFLNRLREVRRHKTQNCTQKDVRNDWHRHRGRGGGRGGGEGEGRCEAYADKGCQSEGAIPVYPKEGVCYRMVVYVSSREKGCMCVVVCLTWEG
jgi:hypothetical protein